MANSKKARSTRRSINQDTAKEINESLVNNMFPLNPIKRQIKLKQFPWTQKQKDFFKLALHPDTKIVLVNGPAGTSKTLLATYCALQLLNMKTISDIMYLRSAVESSDRSLGYLPGSAEEKLRFFNLPFLDKLDELLESTRVEKLEQEGRISMFPVNFARGMNWQGKCIILDEAQNSTIKEITTVLTRLGEGSKCFILADPMQTDIKQGDKQHGFEKMFNLFTDQESIAQGINTFVFDEEDVMRSELVKYLTKKLKLIC
jgi:phosphate starvation-inducible protein PhoH and related proteins